MQTSLTPTSLMVWTMGTSMGLGLFMFPRLLVNGTGRGALFGLVFLGALTGIGVWLMLNLMARFPGQTVVEIARRTLGRRWGSLFEALVGVFMILFLAATLALFTFFIRNTALQRTPTLAINIVMSLVVLYAGWQGLHPISRALQIIVVPTVVLVLVLYVTSWGNLEGFRLVPTWTGLGTVTRGGLAEFFIVGGLQNLMIVLAYTRVDQARRWVWLGTLFNLTMLLIIYVSAVGALGIKGVEQVFWPASYVLRLTSFPGFFIERLGYLVLIAWTMVEMVFFAVNVHLAALALSQLMGLRTPQFRGSLAAIVIVISALASLAPSTPWLVHWIEAVVAPGTLFMVLARPLILYAIAAKRGIAGPAPPH